MPKLSVTEKKKVDVQFLKASCGVRYWEDSEVNGEPDETGEKIPFRNDDRWEPVIDLDTGIIQGWPKGTTASIHYKVCDAGRYELLDDTKNVVAAIEGYVPVIMSPAENGYGDYVIMDVDENGKIGQWKVNLDAFQNEDE